MSSSSSSSPTETLLKSLTNKGWCFSDIDHVKAIITVHSAASTTAVNTSSAVESELCNLDLRSVGGKSLPDFSLLRKSSCSIQPPKILQIASVRDISRSSGVDGFKSSSNRRLLKLVLTDGHSEVTAVEYAHIPLLSDDVVPGTKVRLEKKVVVHYGIICLTPDAITVLGGIVPSLYEEWQMNQKYSGFSRLSLRLGQEGNAGGPPPFEKLQIGRVKHGSVLKGKLLASKNSDSTVSKSSKEVDIQLVDQKKSLQAKGDTVNSSFKTASTSQGPQEKPTASDSRPKEVADYVPIQNQAAAQKLLQKMNNPNFNNERHRGQRFRGRGKEEETEVFTLDEWERRKAGGTSMAIEERIDLSRDEDLAWQLQNQFNLEDQEQRGPSRDKAEDIKMSMFSFERDDNDSGSYGRAGPRRGRGRGRRGGSGWGRGRGRGRG